jgi:hypothetical protein
VEIAEAVSRDAVLDQKALAQIDLRTASTSSLRAGFVNTRACVNKYGKGEQTSGLA